MITQYSKDMERVIIALNLCRKFHEGQTDKCGQPYWTHPFTVAKQGFDDNDFSHVVVGLLHDVPEDTEISVEELATLIELTDEEIDALKLLTRNKNISYDQYIDSIANSNNIVAMTVKRDDLLDNMDLVRFIDAKIPITSADKVRALKYTKKFEQISEAIDKLQNKKEGLSYETL